MHFDWPRAWRLFVALCMVCAVGAALAQDPRTTPVQTAAREWLTLVDHGDAQSSWAAAGQKFQAAISVAMWAAALKKEQARMGTVLRRTAGPTRFQHTLPGAPGGE